jgi:hypothetical protein
MTSTAEPVVISPAPRSRAVLLWSLVAAAVAAAVLTVGGLLMTGAAILVIVLTWAATDLARGAATPRQLIGPLLASGGILFLAMSPIQFMLVWRETSRTPIDEIGYRLFWPAAIALTLAIVTLPVSRRTSWAAFARGFAWASATALVAAMLLEQLAGIGL